MSRYKNFEEIEAAGAIGKTLAIGRKGAKVAARNYALDDITEVPTLQAEYAAGNKLPNPFNLGFQHYLLETMKQLGLNKNHGEAVVIDKFKEVTSEAATKNKEGKTFWQVWSKKEPRNENGRDMLGRFEQNIEVYQRLGGYNPCGRKLLQLGTKVLGTKGVVYDITTWGKKLMIRLNTDSNTPVNDTKRTYKTGTVAETVESTEPSTEPVVATEAPTVAPIAPETAPTVETPVEITPIAEVPATEVVAEPVVTTEPVEVHEHELEAVSL